MISKTQYIQIIISKDEETNHSLESQESVISEANENIDDYISADRQIDDIYLTGPNSEI